MQRILIVMLIALFGRSLASGLDITDRQVKDALVMLDQQLKKRDSYMAARQERIDSLYVSCITGQVCDSVWFDAAMEIADEYTVYCTDSALYYYTIGYNRAVRQQHDSLSVAFKLKRAVYMPLIGFIDEAKADYESIDVESLPKPLKELYYDAGRQMYSYIASFFMAYPNVYSKWSALSVSSQMSLIELLDPDTPKYKLNQGEFYFVNNEFSMARAIFLDLLAGEPDNSNVYARAAHKLAEIARMQGQRNDYIYYLALSAMADIKSATLEMMSLQELGATLFQLEDINRAHSYLSVALASAVKCGALMRTIQSSEAMPIIESAHKAELQEWRYRIYAFIALLALMLVLLLVLLLFLRRKMTRLKLLQRHLRDANNIKELYIGQFMKLCSSYMDKLQQLNKLVNRKIASGKVDDLYKITKSGKFVEEQSKEFYEIFDNAFLHIYPTFVNEVNKLLQDDQKIILQEGELLNTDLRLLAFMRLGIDDGTRIAQILNYSVNTIYAYRNKLKNRAIDRASFESDVMKISSVL